jgi:hypothetical protein
MMEGELELPTPKQLSMTTQLDGSDDPKRNVYKQLLVSAYKSPRGFRPNFASARNSSGSKFKFPSVDPEMLDASYDLWPTLEFARIESRR